MASAVSVPQGTVRFQPFMNLFPPRYVFAAWAITGSSARMIIYYGPFRKRSCCAGFDFSRFTPGLSTRLSRYAHLMAFFWPGIENTRQEKTTVLRTEQAEGWLRL